MANLVICLMYSDRKLLEGVKKVLEEKFGKVKDSVSYDFSFTKYYEEEMGLGLKKEILIFENEISVSQLPEIKLYTNKLEDDYRVNGRRRINIDPGYLTKEELMLASNKKSPYKTSLGKDVYGHLTLKFDNGTCLTTHRTYPDFKKEKVQKFFIKNIKK